MSISTHVLDTMRGTPAAGLGVSLHRREPDGDWKEVAQAETDSDGRVGEMTNDELEPAEYRLEFDTRPYFERSGLSAFYPSVLVVFSFEGGHLHVPLLLTAYGYTGYIYLAVVLIASFVWLGLGISGFTAKNSALWARKMFFCSLIVIMTISFIIPIDALLRQK